MTIHHLTNDVIHWQKKGRLTTDKFLMSAFKSVGFICFRFLKQMQLCGLDYDEYIKRHWDDFFSQKHQVMYLQVRNGDWVGND